MDSRLLNVFHDDPFDGNYTNTADFWANGSDSMSLQLAETLHGILPIAATEDATKLYSNAILKDDFIPATTSFENAEGMYYDELTPGEGVEIITVDPNDLVTDSDDPTEENNDDYYGIDEYDELISENADDDDVDDCQSVCSDATFRTRTDSSSIGDYESHTSDYDETDNDGVAGDDDNAAADYELTFPTEVDATGLLQPDDLVFDTRFDLPLETNSMGQSKNRTISTNTLGSDVDANNFDLAEFITKDDFALKARETRKAMNEQGNKNATNGATTSTNTNFDSDAESDVIVDVETVDVDANKKNNLSVTPLDAVAIELPVDDVAYVDNVVEDPSWSPKTKKKSEVKARGVNLQKNLSCSPANRINKKQNDILKRKSGTKIEQMKNGLLKRKIDMGPLSKGKLESSTPPDKNKIKPKSSMETEKSEHPSPETTDESPESQEQNKELKATTELVVKRKLNLEEYKKRREEGVAVVGHDPGRTTQKLKETETEATDRLGSKKMDSPSNTSAKHSEAVISVVKSLKESQQNQKPITDPITEAKNKVLRMQELKRAQQLKILDSTVSAKVPRVTKLPPLKEIVKDTYCAADPQDQEKQSAEVTSKSLPEYEEIIIVSVGSGTDISLPCRDCDLGRQLPKSSVLLYNISNTFRKVQSTDSVKLSSNSLITSIQNVVVKKSLPPAVDVPKSNNGIITKDACSAEQHGEDKIIMHLRKDRIRKRTVNAGVQTELHPAFPPLVELGRSRTKNRGNLRGRTAMTTSASLKSTVTCTEDSDSDGVSASGTGTGTSTGRSQAHMPSYRSRSRSVDSHSSSTDRMRRCDTTGGYSSRSSRRHRSSVSSSYSESERFARKRRQRRASYKQRNHKYSRSSSVSSLSDYSAHNGHRRSRSRSCSRSCSRSRSHGRYSRSRSPKRRYSPSRSRSRSPSHLRYERRRGHNRNNYVDRNVSQPAVEERRIVYVGRIEQETTKELLRRKFIAYGTIKQITIHYKENGMKYGFVTFERSEDAFAVIDSSMRDPTINMYDISFGGRRAFCRASYADLDNAGINTYHSIVFPKMEPPVKEDDSFEALLQKVKAKLSTSKSSSNENKI